MTSIALFGAGGKMGYRLASNLKTSPFEVRHVEISEAGQARLLGGLGIVAMPPDAALDGGGIALGPAVRGGVVADELGERGFQRRVRWRHDAPPPNPSPSCGRR